MLLLLLSGAFAQPESAPPAGDTGEAAGDSTEANITDVAIGSTGKPLGVAAELLQRLAEDMQDATPDSSSSSSNTMLGRDSSSNAGIRIPKERPDFASTANALAQQAVRDGGARASRMAQQQQILEAGFNSNSTVNSRSTGANAATLQLLELKQQAANNSSSDASTRQRQSSGLQLLLRTIRQQWQATRSRQRQRQVQQQQQQQPGNGGQSTAAPASVADQWTAGLEALAVNYPSLSAFARLAGNNSAFMVGP